MPSHNGGLRVQCYTMGGCWLVFHPPSLPFYTNRASSCRAQTQHQVLHEQVDMAVFSGYARPGQAGVNWTVTAQ